MRAYVGGGCWGRGCLNIFLESRFSKLLETASGGDYGEGTH